MNFAISVGRERQGGESSRAYRAFCFYCDLGPDRSLDRAWQQFCGSETNRSGTQSKRRPGYWAAWCTKYDWVTRTEAYDDAIEEEKLAAGERRRRELQERRSRFEEREQSHIEGILEKTDTMLRKMTEAPVTDVTQTKTETIDGVVTRTKTRVVAIKGRDVAVLLKERNQTSRQATLGVRKEEVSSPPKPSRIVWVESKERVTPITPVRVSNVENSSSRSEKPPGVPSNGDSMPEIGGGGFEAAEWLEDPAA
jgi:hypothetical protein